MAGTLQVYSYNRCSTCRKALAWLTERGIAHEVHDITLTPPSKDMLVAAHQSLGDRKLLFNTSGQSYRAMGAAAVKALSDDEALRPWLPMEVDQTPFVEVNSSTTSPASSLIFGSRPSRVEVQAIQFADQGVHIALVADLTEA